MSTSFEPAARELRAPLSRAASHYRDSAELCAAILAAANLAPEFAPKPHRDTFPAGAYQPGPESKVHRADGSIDWEADFLEWQGPLIPKPAPRHDARAVFAYRMADGTRGQLSSANDRPALLALAERLGTPAAIRAWSGKVRSGPVKRAKPAGSAPRVAARAMFEAREYAESVQMAETAGPVFFGAGALNLYMAPELHEAAGQGFTIARSVRTGRFLVLHTDTANQVCGLRTLSADGAPDHRDNSGFKSGAAALDWLETIAQCDHWRAKLAAAIPKAAPLDQAAARAAFLAGEPMPATAPETGRQAHEAAPAGAQHSEPAAGPESAPISESAARDARELLESFYDEHLPGVLRAPTVPLQTWKRRAAWRRLAAARGLRVLSENFSEYEARAWCEPDPAAAPTVPAQEMRPDSELIGAARLTEYRYLPNWARMAIERADSDNNLRHGAAMRELCHAYARTYGQVPGADELGSVLHICARRFHDYRPILAQAAPEPAARPVQARATGAEFEAARLAHAIGAGARADAEQNEAAALATFAKECGARDAMAAAEHKPGAGAIIAAADTLARITATWAPDAARASLIQRGRMGAAGAAPGLAGVLTRCAELSRGIERDEARRALAALQAAPVEPSPVPTHTAPGPLATHTEPAPRAPRDGDRFRIHEISKGSCGVLWTAGPDVSIATRDYHVRQTIDAGWLSGQRWATCAETGAFLYGIGPNGRPMKAAPVFVPPVPVNTGAPEKPAAPDWFAEILAKADARKFRARVLADGAEFKEFGGGSVRMVHANDATRYGLAGPCMSTPGRFRFTHFDAHGPVGDLGFTCLADAIDEALQMGYEPVPPGAPDPAGLHPLPGKSDPAPLPVATQSQDCNEAARPIGWQRKPGAGMLSHGEAAAFDAAARPVHSLARLRAIHDRINATRATTSTAHGRRWVRIMNDLRTLMHSHPDYATAYRFATLARVVQARSAPPPVRIHGMDPRTRIPATMAPGYLLRAL